MLTNLRWGDPDHTFVLADQDGATAHIPAESYLLVADEDLDTGERTLVAIADYVPPVTIALPVPERVTNFQARSVMRQYPMPDGRSLFTTIDTALREARDAASWRPEFDPIRIEADLDWQAWEQANDYERHGAITTMLAGRYGFDDALTDTLFRQAALVTA